MKTAMLAQPCKSCPFRKDKPIYLRRARRVEIATALLSGQTFFCHSTVDYNGDDEDEWGDSVPDTSGSTPCAGAEKSLMHVGLSSQMGRIAQRLGIYEPDKLAEKGHDVWDIHEWQRVAEGTTADNEVRDDEEVGTCNTVGPYCIAPAGFAVGGGVTYGTEAADAECIECGEAVCSECIDPDGRCGMCTEEEDDD